MSQYCFGVDVGGTTVKLGLFSPDGTILDKWEIPTRTQDSGKEILPDVAASVEAKLTEKSIAKSDVIGVGIGVPGPVDGQGVVRKAVNLGWGVFDAKAELEKLLGLPVEVGNDANVAALGEMWCGGGKGYQNLVLATLGTGVGGGIIIDGKIVTGATGAGGEIGHICMNPSEEEACGCGKRGCLEQYASATGIVRLANRKLAAVTEDSVLRTQEISAKTVFDAVKAGDKVACEIAEEFGEYLGKGLAMIAAVVNPEAFVIGGGVSKAGDILCEYVTKYYQQYAFHGCAEAVFKLATLGNDAGICGAAKLVIK